MMEGNVVKLFKNKEVFDEDYIPAQLPGREDESRELLFKLQDCDECRSYVMIPGLTGTGKTVLVKKVLGDLNEAFNGKNKKLRCLYVNCRDNPNRLKIMHSLVNQMNDGEKSIKHYQTCRYEEIFEEKIKDYDAIVVFLDEPDYLITNDVNNRDYIGILYTLYEMKECKISIVMATNELNFHSRLDPQIQSRIGHDVLFLHPYTAPQLNNILIQRSDQSLNNGCLSDQVIPLCSAMAAQEHGDARKSIVLLKTSIEIAETEGSVKVNEKHVRRAKTKIEVREDVEQIRALPNHMKFILIAITNAKHEANEMHKRKKRKDTIIYSNEIMDEYIEICGKKRTPPVTQRRVVDYLSELDMLGLINKRVISKGRYGKTSEITISFTPGGISMALQENDDFDGLFKEKVRRVPDKFKKKTGYQLRIVS